MAKKKAKTKKKSKSKKSGAAGSTKKSSKAKPKTKPKKTLSKADVLMILKRTTSVESFMYLADEEFSVRLTVAEVKALRKKHGVVDGPLPEWQKITIIKEEIDKINGEVEQRKKDLESLRDQLDELIEDCETVNGALTDATDSVDEAMVACEQVSS